MENKSSCVHGSVINRSTYQSNDGTFCGELCSAEERPDKTVDQFVFWVYAGIVIWHWFSLNGSNRSHTHTQVTHTSEDSRCNIKVTDSPSFLEKNRAWVFICARLCMK